VQAATPLAVVVAAFLFFAGHNRPGGGFAAGLVLGAVVALRRVAGLQRPIDAVRLLAAGGLIAGFVAVAPLLTGGALLDQVVVTETLPILGKVKSGTAALFDAGVTLIVVGLVVAVLDGLVGDQLDERSATTGPAHDREGRR
jgi:multicomponent Na+:H+ antiporter subunit A